MTGPANDNKPERTEARVARCPICTKPFDTKYRPFCSKHCADVDLARWLGGRYAVPVRPEEDEDGMATGEGEER